MSELKKNQEKDEKLSSKDYENLLDQYQFSSQEMKPGSLIKGRVVRITSEHVLVDVGYKSEGIIPLGDFTDPEVRESLAPGVEVEAILERGDRREGYLILSKKRATSMRAIKNLETAFQNNSWIIGKVQEKIRNGYVVDVGIQTFMPDSHADMKIVKDPKQLLGNRYKFKVLKFDAKSENAVLSRKNYLMDEQEKKRQQVFSQIQRGMKVKGTVRTLTNFGAFVDIGGVEGLLHISDMSWGKLNHPSEVFVSGQEIEVLILDFDKKEDRISLGYKQMTPDPWKDIDVKYMPGQKVVGKVVSLTDFGAFVELEKGVEGLIHISDLTWSRKPVHPKKVLSPGEEVTVSILSVKTDTKRISLGLKQTSPHPLEVLRGMYSPGSRIKGTITSITDFGAFMKVDEDVEGLIHISDISWKKIKHPSDVLKAGEETEAVILNIDIEKQKLSLGIKQLQGDIWEDFFQRQKSGDLVKVKIIRIVDFGVFVEITPGIEGVVFLSELDEKRIEDPGELFKVGDEKHAKILKMSQSDKKLSLSFKQAQLDLQKIEYQKYAKSQDGSLTFGDIMSDQIKSLGISKTKKTEKIDDKVKPEEAKVEAKKEKKTEEKPKAKEKKGTKEAKDEKKTKKAEEKEEKKKTAETQTVKREKIETIKEQKESQKIKKEDNNKETKKVTKKETQKEGKDD